MKLATYDDGSRNGQLVVVSRDLKTAHYATGVAGSLQQVADDWNFLAPQLEELSLALEHGKARHAFEFDPRRCAAPLPRPGLWAEPDPTDSGTRLLIGRSDAVMAPYTRLPGLLADPGGGIVLAIRGQLAVLMGDVAAAAPAEAALEGVRLVLLACSLRWEVDRGEPDGNAAAAGGAHAVTFAPLALTPDELGDAWSAGPASIGLRIRIDALPDAPATDTATPAPMLGELLRAAARFTGLRSGALIGCGSPAGAALRVPLSAMGERLRIEVDGGRREQPFGTLELLLREPA
jgi:fumarylacetoacetate (FAA) hydrolase